MYKLNPNATIDRGFRIPKDTSIEEYIKAELYYPNMLTDNRVIVATLDGLHYGLNVTAAIILEFLLDGLTETECVRRIAALFKGNTARIVDDYHQAVNYLLSKKILLKEDLHHVNT